MMLLCLALLGALQDQVSNPEYEGWARFKPGSSVTMRIQTDPAPAKNSYIVIKSTFDKISEDLVELKTQGDTYFEGKKIMSLPSPDEKRAKLDAKTFPEALKQGDETLDLAGKKVKCHWKETDEEWEFKKCHLKTWWTEEIPGGIAKRTITPPAGGVTTHLVTAWEKK